MAVIAKSSIVLLNKAIHLHRFLSVVSAIFISLTPLSFSSSVLAEGESGAEQLRQFVRNSKTAEGEFVQQLCMQRAYALHISNVM